MATGQPDAGAARAGTLIDRRNGSTRCTTGTPPSSIAMSPVSGRLYGAAPRWKLGASTTAVNATTPVTPSGGVARARFLARGTGRAYTTSRSAPTMAVARWVVNTA